MQMRADQFVMVYGEAGVGMVIGTMKMGEYPGGWAEVIGVAPDPAAPEIVLDVKHPAFGEIGVFDYETVTVRAIDPDESLDSRPILRHPEPEGSVSA